MAEKLVLPTADMWVRSAVLTRIELRKKGVEDMLLTVPTLRERARRAYRAGDYRPLRVTELDSPANAADITSTVTERRTAWRNLAKEV